MNAKKRKRPRKANGPKLPRSIRRLFPNLKDVTDATAPVHVTVTKRDCTNGKRLKAGECALAVAAQRQYHAQGAVIGMSYSYIVRGDHAIRFATPASVAREIVSFDRHGDFAPGEYGLSAVSPSNRLGKEKVERPGDHGSKKISRIVHKGTARVRVVERGSE